MEKEKRMPPLFLFFYEVGRAAHWAVEKFLPLKLHRYRYIKYPSRSGKPSATTTIKTELANA